MPALTLRAGAVSGGKRLRLLDQRRRITSKVGYVSGPERLQGVFVLLAGTTGLVIGQAVPVGAFAEHVVVPALVLMLVGVFTQVSASELREARRGRRVVVASLVLNFVWTPAFAWVLGVGLLGFSPDLRIGLLMLLVTPCTDWYLVFTGLARGHLGIAAAVLPINFVLQLVLLPVYVLLLGGTAAPIDGAALVEAVGLVLLVPLVAAMLLRWLATRLRGQAWREQRLVPAAERAVAPLLYLAVLAMFTWQGHLVFEEMPALAALLLPLGIFFVGQPLLATAVSRVLALPDEHRVTLTMVTVARNSPIALALAAAAFPDRPLIAISLVIGPLIELPVLAILSQIARARRTGNHGS